jgi:cob(I)alamin adenosyltransferase
MLGCASAEPRRLRIYTRTGDKGQSSLYNGTRASKADPVFFALGDTDELNANVGLALAHCSVVPGLDGDENWKALLERLSVIQSRLLDAGTAIATPLKSSREDQLARAAFPEAAVADLESWIDNMEEQLPVLRNFILPVCELR